MSDFAPPIIHHRTPAVHHPMTRRQRQQNLGLYIAVGLIAHALIITGGGYMLYRLEARRITAEFQDAVESLQGAQQAPIKKRR